MQHPASIWTSTMHAATALPSATSQLATRLAGAPAFVWALAAFAFVAIKSLVQDGPALVRTLGDTDDALRLLQVREFVAGAPWLDATIARIGADGLASHWSRLIDLPLALLIGLLGLVLPAETAELIVRAIWPLLVLAPLMLLLAVTTEKAAGRHAAAFALLLAASSFSALMQFKAGRIDHHNVQIAGAIGAVLLLWTADKAPRHGIWAGLLAGLAVAVGYEALPLVAIAALALALWALADARMAPAASRFAITTAALLTAALVATTAPSRWGSVACDTLTANMVALAIVGATGVWFALGRYGADETAKRLVALGAFAAAGLALFGALEPACLRGPFGQVPAALVPIWLDQVMETQSIVWLVRTQPAGGIACLLGFAAALAAQVVLWRRTREGHHLFLLAILAPAFLLAVWQIKYLSYASWLAVVPLAVAIARAEGTPSISTPLVRAAGLTLLNQSALIGVAGGLVAAWLAVTGTEPRKDTANGEACFDTPHLEALRQLPAGMIVADVDLGPFIVATSQHRVLSAPYHRNGQGILAAHGTLASDAATARRHLAEAKATYLVKCRDRRHPLIEATPAGNNLVSLIARGAVPNYLVPVPMPAASPFQVWRFEGTR
jgi:hypothetical protein